MVFLNEFSEKVGFEEKKLVNDKGHAKFPGSQRVLKAPMSIFIKHKIKKGLALFAPVGRILF